MSRRCSTAQCGGQGLFYVEKGRYVCERCADRIRNDLAAATAMHEPISMAEREQHAAQAANSHSLTDIYPELRDPAVLNEHIRLWRQLEEDR